MVNFECGQDDAELQRHVETINDKSKLIANSLIGFPHGKAIVQSAETKAKKHSSFFTKQKKAVDELAAVAEGFPNPETPTQFGAVMNQYSNIFGDSNMDKPTRTPIIDAATPHLEKIFKKLDQLFEEEALPHLLALASVMDYSKAPSMKLQEVLPGICETLPKYDDAHRSRADS